MHNYLDTVELPITPTPQAGIKLRPILFAHCAGCLVAGFPSTQHVLFPTVSFTCTRITTFVPQHFSFEMSNSFSHRDYHFFLDLLCNDLQYFQLDYAILNFLCSFVVNISVYIISSLSCICSCFMF